MFDPELHGTLIRALLTKEWVAWTGAKGRGREKGGGDVSWAEAGGVARRWGHTLATRGLAALAPLGVMMALRYSCTRGHMSTMRSLLRKATATNSSRHTCNQAYIVSMMVL